MQDIVLMIIAIVALLFLIAAIGTKSTMEGFASCKYPAWVEERGDVRYNPKKQWTLNNNKKIVGKNEFVNVCKEACRNNKKDSRAGEWGTSKDLGWECGAFVLDTKQENCQGNQKCNKKCWLKQKTDNKRNTGNVNNRHTYIASCGFGSNYTRSQSNSAEACNSIQSRTLACKADLSRAKPNGYTPEDLTECRATYDRVCGTPEPAADTAAALRAELENEVIMTGSKYNTRCPDRMCINKWRPDYKTWCKYPKWLGPKESDNEYTIKCPGYAADYYT